MDRIDRLRKILEVAQVPHRSPWLPLERRRGRDGAILEMCALFASIKRVLVNRSKIDRMDWRARNVKPEARTPYDEAIYKVAQSNVDKEALMEVILTHQMVVVEHFLHGLHDGAADPLNEAENLEFFFAFEDREEMLEGQSSRSPERIHVFPNELGARFADFMAEPAERE